MSQSLMTRSAGRSASKRRASSPSTATRHSWPKEWTAIAISSRELSSSSTTSTSSGSMRSRVTGFSCATSEAWGHWSAGRSSRCLAFTMDDKCTCHAPARGRRPRRFARLCGQWVDRHGSHDVAVRASADTHARPQAPARAWIRRCGSGDRDARSGQACFVAAARDLVRRDLARAERLSSSGVVGMPFA